MLQNKRNRVRWIDYARRSMQRLGFLKLVLSRGSASRTQTLEALTRAFEANITKRVDVPENMRDVLEDYIQKQQLRRRYNQGSMSAQIQDLYLSDPSLPSHTGAITGNLDSKGYRHSVYVEIPAWAVRLRLLREQNYTLTDRGRVLLNANPVNAEPISQVDGPNPLKLHLSERYVFLYSLIDADGDFLIALYSRLLERNSFTRTDAGAVALTALEDLRNSRLRKISAGPLQGVRGRVERAITSIKNQKRGGLGPKESIATPRTEPLVDCGVLMKPITDKYEYCFSPWGRQFLTQLVSAPSVEAFLETGLSLSLAMLTGQPVNAMPLVGVVAPSYTNMRTGLGYVSLRELAVATIADCLGQQSRSLFEIAAIEESLKRAASTQSKHVRLAVGRTGGIAQVRIDLRAFTNK